MPTRAWTREEALVEIVRGRLEGLGPVTQTRARRAARARRRATIAAALAALEAEGFAMRGRFTPGRERRGMVRAPAARAHPPLHGQAPARRDRAGRRARLPALPVRLAARRRRTRAWRGRTRSTAVVAQLEGFEAPAGAWETEILPARLADYEPAWLDDHCLAGPHRLGAAARRATRGRTARARRGAGARRRRSRCCRAAMRALWTSLSAAATRRRTPSVAGAGGRRLHPRSTAPRSSTSWSTGTGLLRPQVEEALGELVALGLVDVRQLRRPARAAGAVRPSASRRRRRRRGAAPSLFGMEDAGRWALRAARPPAARRRRPDAEAVEHVARTLLRRYGVVFWRLLEREAAWLPPWRDLLRVYRRLEARGEIRGGRFVAGFSGEQFALPEAIGMLREIRRKPASGELGLALRRRSAEPGRHPDARAEARRADRQPRALPRRPAGRLARGGDAQFYEALDPGAEWQARKALLHGATPPTVADLAAAR